jgi:hypothetical protein
VLEIESAETGLDERRQDVPVRGEPLELVRVAHSATLLDEPLAQFEPAANDGAALARDDVGTKLGEPAFLGIWEALVELLRDREPEDAVPEELEPLIGICPVGRPRGVREGVLETRGGQGVDELEKGAVGALGPALLTGGTRCSRRPDRLW